MTPLYIFDLDGTLALCEHRLHHIQKTPKDWRAFFAACGEDKPCRGLIDIAHTLARGGAEIRIWTGRSDEVREETVAWLGRHQVPFGELRMRPAKDHSQDDDLKLEWLRELFLTPASERLAGAFEDRTRVVEMWREHGVPCFQVAAGDF